MARTVSLRLLDTIEIASPCTARWEDMNGDDRSRHCGDCRLNVYNLSAMTQDEAEALIIEKEGRLCARIYRRADGTILTRDCPVGLRLIRQRAARAAARIAAAAACLIGGALTMAGINTGGTAAKLRRIQPFSTICEWISPGPAPVSLPVAGMVAVGKLSCPPIRSSAPAQSMNPGSGLAANP